MTTTVSKWGWGLAIWLIPGLTTFTYFNISSPTNQILYALGKIFYLSIPLYFFFKRKNFPWKFRRLERRTLIIVLVFTVIVFFSTQALASFIGWNSPLFMTLSKNLALKLQDFGLKSIIGFWVLATFTSFLNSFIEEIYWRGFAFEKLSPTWRAGPAVFLTALFFSLHHIAALHAYLGWTYIGVTISFSMATSIGAFFWSWLYLKTRSLFWCWVSHILIDISIMSVGYTILMKNSLL